MTWTDDQRIACDGCGAVAEAIDVLSGGSTWWSLVPGDMEVARRGFIYHGCNPDCAGDIANTQVRHKAAR